MVEIIDNRTKPKPFYLCYLNSGDMFEYDGDFYIVTMERDDKDDTVGVIVLESGEYVWLHREINVKPIKVKILISDLK